MKLQKSALALALALIAVPVGVSAQMDGEILSWHQEQVNDAQTMADKFVALAEAFPEDTYDWRPMEGVRSVRDVMALMVAEFYLFPELWGADRPANVMAGGWGPVINGYAEMSKAELVDALRASSAHFMSTITDLTDADRAEAADWFGRAVTTGSAIGIAAGDMHEHLGQSIAYARANGVVPPWSN